MATTVRLDDNKVLQLIRNNKLWSQFPVFKNLALRAQSATTKIQASNKGCSSCGARKRISGQNGLTQTIKAAKEAIIKLSPQEKSFLKKALNADYIRIVVYDAQNKPKEIMY